jgi:Xaa-Pro aminopeptidase
MNKYISLFRKLPKQHKLDALIVYSSNYESRFAKALIGVESVLEDYILITKNMVVVSQPRFLVEDTKKKTSCKIIGALNESRLIDPLLGIIGKNKRIGIIGNCKYSDISKVKPAIVMELTSEANEIISFKSDSYIKHLAKVAQDLRKIMNGLCFNPGDNQLNVAKKVRQQIINANYETSFPICITSGKDLINSTSLLPQKKKINKKDIACVDMGIKRGIYATDMTREFFVNHPHAEKLYAKISGIHNNIISKFVSPEHTFRNIINKYKSCVEKLDGVKEVQELGFGHGIGFGLHEYPELENVNRNIGKNIVFTIEPTVHTIFGRLRREDMIGILSNGRVLKLT